MIRRCSFFHLPLFARREKQFFSWCEIDKRFTFFFLFTSLLHFTSNELIRIIDNALVNAIFILFEWSFCAVELKVELLDNLFKLLPVEPNNMSNYSRIYRFLWIFLLKFLLLIHHRWIDVN